MNRAWRLLLLLVCVAGGLAAARPARAEAETKADVYGFVMMDAGYNDQGIDPDWFDVQRPTKLAPIKDGWGKDGSTFFSARQTRFGVKTTTPTEMGELFTQFEWEMFGVGVDAGQTTIRLRHAYGQIGKWGAGQYWSPFMDIDVFPNTVEYWGPPGMAFFRNVQLRYMPIQGDTRMTIALERPGASADQGTLADRVDLSGVKPLFPLPDLSAEYRKAIKKGYVEIAGIVRDIKWQDTNPAPPDISGSVTGWGIHASSNLKFGMDVLRLSVLYGEGIENYMNDAPVDVAPKSNTSTDGKALPVTGIVAFLDHTWNKKYTSSVGFSSVSIDNSDAQTADAFKLGEYALANVLYTPVPNVMMGVEGGWIHRENKQEGVATTFNGIAGNTAKVDQYHVQVSAKYNFALSLGAGH
jgi:hypothetical protein